MKLFLACHFYFRVYIVIHYTLRIRLKSPTSCTGIFGNRFHPQGYNSYLLHYSERVFLATVSIHKGVIPTFSITNTLPSSLVRFPVCPTAHLSIITQAWKAGGGADVVSTIAFLPSENKERNATKIRQKIRHENEERNATRIRQKIRQRKTRMRHENEENTACSRIRRVTVDTRSEGRDK